MWQNIPATRYKDKSEFLRTLIAPGERVLDVGFWGQANTKDMAAWPHRIIGSITENLWGVDLTYDDAALARPDRYQRASAESFAFDQKFDVVVALDLIEHVPNPGLFLDCAKRHLAENGRLILSTPNAFNLFALAGKLARPEPWINSDHVAYYNRPTLFRLLAKCGWAIQRFGFLYTLGQLHEESGKKKVLNMFYRLLSRHTDKFYETLIVVARPAKS